MAKESSFCHVFLSFKGETRNTFTCFLYEALKAEGFVPFMDKTAIRVGEEVDASIKEGIKGSMSAIIVFSKNFACSTWCLDELVLILERVKVSRYFIIPIFYEVEPADIKHQLGNYGEALEKHKVRHNDKVEKWRAALHEVGNILGEHVEGMHSNFIKNIVDLFRKKLSETFPECRLPLPKNEVQQYYPLSSSSSASSKDKIILYTYDEDEGFGGTAILKIAMKNNNMFFKEINCSKQPQCLEELEEVVEEDEIKFPVVIVNGMDLCGPKYVESLDGLPDKYYNIRGLVNLLQLEPK